MLQTIMTLKKPFLNSLAWGRGLLNKKYINHEKK